MTSHFVPFEPLRSPPARTRKPRARIAAPARTVRRRTNAPTLAWCVLVTIVVLEVALLGFGQRLQVSPLQGTVLFRQLTGYAMLTLMALAFAFGALRRLPALASRVTLLNDVHQFAGLLLLMLLAFHIGEAPRGFLLYTFHALAVGLAAGALRAVGGRSLGRGLATFLLSVHISVSCLLAAGALVHLYFVYAYTA